MALTYHVPFSAQVFYPFAMSTSATGYVKFPLIVGMEDSRMFTMSYVWSYLAASGSVVAVVQQSNPGNEEDYVRDYLFACAEMRTQGASTAVPWFNLTNLNTVFVGFGKFAAPVVATWMPIYQPWLPPPPGFLGKSTLSGAGQRHTPRV